MHLINKAKIIENICYTELVYGRINKKLNTQFSNEQIEETLLKILEETPEKLYTKTGKNYYVTNQQHNIRITINSYTHRIITVDRLDKMKVFSIVETKQ